MNKYSLLIAGCVFGMMTHAASLYKNTNSLRPGDILIKQQLECKDPGAAGKDITWDFSHVNAINDKYQLVYYYPLVNDTIHLDGYEHNTGYHYTMNSDTLWLTGYMNPTTVMNYSKPEALLRFPFYYGDTLRSTFEGRGKYCQRIDLYTGGYTTVVADATGKLITPDNDTLNVIRIVRTKEITNTGTDSASMRMHTYQWFATGSRYPVFETVRSYTMKGDSAIESFSTSFYFSTISRELLPQDLANIKDNTAGAADDILINCSTYPNPVVNDVLINYELSVDAHVSFLLCDISGRPWASVSDKAMNAGIQQQKLPMGGLPIGNYGLYIRVNDRIYRKTIIKT